MKQQLHRQNLPTQVLETLIFLQSAQADFVARTPARRDFSRQPPAAQMYAETQYHAKPGSPAANAAGGSSIVRGTLMS